MTRSTSAVQKTGSGPSSIFWKSRTSSRPKRWGVVVGVEHRMRDRDLLADHLDPEFRAGVDEEIAAGDAEEYRSARARILGIGRGADGTPAADHRHADGGAAAEDDEGSRRIRHDGIVGSIDQPTSQHAWTMTFLSSSTMSKRIPKGGMIARRLTLDANGAPSWNGSCARVRSMEAEAALTSLRFAASSHESANPDSARGLQITL